MSRLGDKTMPEDIPDDRDRALTPDERIEVACEWSDYRKNYGVTAEGMTTAHRAFVAGWRARHLHGYEGPAGSHREDNTDA